MSNLKFVHSGGNSVSLTTPDSNPAANRTFKLPGADGTSGQVLQTDGSGALSFATAPGGLFSSYAIIADRKSNGTNGGGSGAPNTWFVRDLNTEIADPDSIVSISSNQFTLAAGTYLFKWTCPAIRTQTYMTALYNVTDSAYSAYGESGYSYTADGDTSHASGIARITISGTKVFEIRMNVEDNNSNSAQLLGRPTNLSSFSGDETYTVVEIYKES